MKIKNNLASLRASYFIEYLKTRGGPSKPPEPNLDLPLILSECLVEAFCILRGVLKCTKIRMSLQLDNASLGF